MHTTKGLSPPEARRYCWRQVTELDVQVDLMCFGTSYSSSTKATGEPALGSSVTLGRKNEWCPAWQFCNSCCQSGSLLGKICGSQGSYASKKLGKARSKLYPLKSILFGRGWMPVSKCRISPGTHGSGGSPGTVVIWLWESDSAKCCVSLLVWKAPTK